jgi:uncharacterized protein YdcH (DUF465 family)
MQNITLNQIHKELMGLKKEVAHIRLVLDEDYELSDHIAEAVEESRCRSEKELISNEGMRAEFGG